MIDDPIEVPEDVPEGGVDPKEPAFEGSKVQMMDSGMEGAPSEPNRTDNVESIAEDLISEQPQVEEAIDRKRRIGLFQSAIFRLGCDIRGPVYLFYVEGYSIRTISLLYGKTPSAIKMVLHRGTRQIERMCRQKTV